MADNFFDMLVFVRVVDAGSLSGAARDLNVLLAVISRKLARTAGTRNSCLDEKT
jgi:DNA-binding transcriptional LysR family regulator